MSQQPSESGTNHLDVPEGDAQELPVTQSSTATTGTASDAGEMLSRRQRDAARSIAQSRAPRRRSSRLHENQSTANSSATEDHPPHVHGYHTRSQPLSARQLRAAVGNPIPKPKSEPSSPSQPIGRARKGSYRISDAEKAKRQKKVDEAEAHLKAINEQLAEDNPLDDLSMDMKKRLASYFVLKQLYGPGDHDDRASVEQRVGDMLGFSATTVGLWSREYEIAGQFAGGRRGQHPKTRSPIGSPEFEDFRQQLRTYIRTEAVGKGGKPNLTVKDIARWINNELCLGEDDGYSERTVSRWLEALDFKLVQVKKTLYVDGHERPDVVADRARLAKQLDEMKPLLLTVDDETLEVKSNPHASFILVSQDEKIHHSNDQQKRYWSDGTNTVLPKKSQGRTIMTSDFLSEVFGFVKFSDQDSHSPGKRVGSLLDVSRDGYYNSDRCLEDFDECSKAVTGLSHGKLHCVFLTDRSPIHCKFAEDALNVRKMNVKPGGKQPKMRDGWFWKAGKRQTQTMVYPDDHPEYPGQAKGLRQVCVERFGKAAINGKRHEEMAAMLSDCADFKSQPTLLEDQALARGDRVIFGVKFHPELAPIEAAYRSIGRALQVANSAGNSAGFKARVQQCQDPPDLTLSLVRKHFRSAREYLKLYVEGKTLAEIEQLRKVKRKHRGPAPALSQAGESSQPSKSGKYPRNRV